MILPELKEWPLGRGSKLSVGLGTDALEGLLSGCEMGVPRGGVTHGARVCESVLEPGVTWGMTY